jgi:uncharacterized protein (DUF486 family)
MGGQAPTPHASGNVSEGHPARIGYTSLSLAQLKILQEVITLSVFVPFALFYMREPLKWDYVWAALCIMGAVYFIFRSAPGTGHV